MMTLWLLRTVHLWSRRVSKTQMESMVSRTITILSRKMMTILTLSSSTMSKWKLFSCKKNNAHNYSQLKSLKLTMTTQI